MRSILFEQPGVIEAEVNFYAGEAQVIYDRAQVTAAELAEVVATYFPAEVVDDRLAEP